MWKNYFYYSKRERWGIMVLMVLILAVGAASFFIPSQWTDTPSTDETFEQEYEAFITSLAERNRETYANQRNNPGWGDRNRNHSQQKALLTPFDPNTADSAGFVQLGLPPWMARNILRYRAKGGTFRKPEEFRKVYGLTEEQFTSLLPYIHIAESPERKDTIQLLAKQTSPDTLRFYKYPAGTIIDLNRADTTELKKIPGIGSGIARLIVNYRKQLGGFYCLEQLADIRLSADKLRHWFSVDPDETQRINLNKASIERINAHPYIDFYQAKVIVEYRQKKGELKSIQQLKLYEEFTSKDMERIAPYVCY